MARMIQIRHVPDDVHRKLKARAALAGMSLSEYLLSEVRRALERPTRAEIIERLARRRPVRLRETAAEAVHAERGRQ
jgi:antitoxin FitA